MKRRKIYIYGNVAYSITRENEKVIGGKMLHDLTKQRILSIMSNAKANIIIKNV